MQTVSNLAQALRLCRLFSLSSANFWLLHQCILLYLELLGSLRLGLRVLLLVASCRRVGLLVKEGAIFDLVYHLCVFYLSIIDDVPVFVALDTRILELLSGLLVLECFSRHLEYGRIVVR